MMTHSKEVFLKGEIGFAFVAVKESLRILSDTLSTAKGNELMLRIVLIFIDVDDVGINLPFADRPPSRNLHCMLRKRSVRDSVSRLGHS